MNINTVLPKVSHKNKLISKDIIIFSFIKIELLLAIAGLIFYKSDSLYLVLSYIGVFQLICSVLTWKKLSNQSIFSVYIIFLIMMYSFLYGQCLMWIFTEGYSGRSIIEIYLKDQIVKAQVFTLASLALFHLSALLSFEKECKKSKQNIQDMSLLSSQKTLGYLLLAISTPSLIVYNLVRGSLAYSYGYIAIYEYQFGTLFNKFLTLREFFLPAVILIIVACPKKKRTKNILIIMVLADALVGLYVGLRADALMQVVALVLLIYTISENFNMRKLLYIGLIGYLMLYIANIVGEIRIIPNKSFEMIWNALTNSDNTGVITNILGELGGSMSTLLETMILVPSQYGFRYGATYLFAFTWLIPPIITNGVDLSRKYASMNTWIDNVRYTGSGWGFSTTGEAYINFGYWGVLIFIILGIIIYKLIGKTGYNDYKLNPVDFSLSYILFSRIMVFGRIDFLSTLPSILYFYILLRVAIYTINNFKNRGRRI